MSRMFKSIDRTWNVFVGCEWDCTYCNARKAALTRFKHLDRYKDGFHPHLVESELSKTFRPGESIFISYMGDISFATRDTMAVIFSRAQQFRETRFLLCTKDPSCFYRWGLYIPDNVLIATTLETNRAHLYSRAPQPKERAQIFFKQKHIHKMVSIEPVMDFDLDIFIMWLRYISPEFVEVGADNYHNNLPEPPKEKLERFIKQLRDWGIPVIEKDGLARLLK